VPVLRDVSFEIEPGATVAVVGATGAGKSTLVNLLLRFYDPTAGASRSTASICASSTSTACARTSARAAGGLPVRRHRAREPGDGARERHDEIARARARGEPRRDGDRSPAGGSAAPVAERGATLSTGERQLLAIARALAGRPRIVVLDEATASVDSATEAQIEKPGRSLLAGRSALVIAHRLSTVRRADQILVMHRGELRERRTHEELVRNGGIYARLHRLQFATNADAPRPARIRAALTRASPI
jgi:ATP-binding cassette subfamily B protein